MRFFLIVGKFVGENRIEKFRNFVEILVGKTKFGNLCKILLFLNGFISIVGG